MVDDRHDRELRYHLGIVERTVTREFAGVFSPETVDRYLRESRLAFADAKVTDFVPVMVERFARERLRVLAQAEGKLKKDNPEVLFVCVHNAGRSQIAAALLERR